MRRRADVLRPRPDSAETGPETTADRFHGRPPPAIIDFTPYWRPATYASAIVVADALVWEGASSEILGAASEIHDFGQYLVRALIFRALTDCICPEDPASKAQETSARWAPAVDLARQPHPALTAPCTPASAGRNDTNLAPDCLPASRLTEAAGSYSHGFGADKYGQ